MLSRNFPSWVVACWGYFAVLVCAWGQDSFLLREPRLRPDGGFEIRFQPLLNHYFVLRRSSDLAGIARPVAAIHCEAELTERETVLPSAGPWPSERCWDLIHAPPEEAMRAVRDWRGSE